MPTTDLDYFCERDMARTDIKDFYESLPSDLQSMFQKCIHVNIVWGNVLQGYRGPSNLRKGHSCNSGELKSSHGIQEIKFWWGARKDLNVLPVIGTVVFVSGRLVQSIQGQLDWSSLYFDSKTGECLSHNKDEASEKLNDRGCQLFNEGKYSEAAEYHENAYQSCYSGYLNKQTFKNNIDKAKSEIDAMNLNSEGDNLFMEGKYSEAYSKYQEACTKTQVNTHYATNSVKAKSEIDAINLNSQGDNLFMEGKYSEAYSKYREACDKSQVDTQHDKYGSNGDKAMSEIDAINLNYQGDNLFMQGQYNEAYIKYQAACDKTKVNTQHHKYATNCDKVTSEIDAMNLNSEGDNLFMEGKYSEAYSKYQEACTKTQVNTQYATNSGKAKSEIDAINLNSQGDNLFMEGKYSEAYIKYYEAYHKSQVNTQHLKYVTNSDKANSEIGAIILNYQGDNLFMEGKYSEAYIKYQEAYHTSQVNTQHLKYVTNSDKANSEIDAIYINAQGDNLFRQGKYWEAHSKYQEAYNKSQITKEKNIYAINKDRVQTIINKLSILHTLWNKAWDAENDAENNRSGEAKDTFEKVLSESKDSLITFPDNLKFKQYETLVSLKIEGNELFNRGLQSQQDGTKCLEQARELKQQQKFKLAYKKYQDAKVKFCDAQKKFTIGSQTDERFLSCIEFVQEQLNEVMESIEIAKSHTLNQGLNDLNINISSDNLDTNADESNIMTTEGHHNYFQQI